LEEQPGDLVLDGLFTTLISPAHDRLETVVVLEQGAVEFCLDRAGGRGTGEAGQADFLRYAGMEFQHGVGLSGVEVWGVEGGTEFASAIHEEVWTVAQNSSPP
jgi:hypothetical protein